jgi:hypothetical protein
LNNKSIDDDRIVLTSFRFYNVAENVGFARKLLMACAIGFSEGRMFEQLDMVIVLRRVVKVVHLAALILSLVDVRELVFVSALYREVEILFLEAGH